jgi:lipoprotein-releasing system ATP-binding protein
VAAGSVVLEVKNVTRTYREGYGGVVTILEGASFYIERGEMVSLVGPSGSGKTTMLQLCGLLDRVDSGDIRINGVSTAGLNERERTYLRRDNIGFVYQMHHLFPEFSAIENTMLPLLAKGCSNKLARERAMEILGQLGIYDKRFNMPAELSGGERQRVAIARALVTDPSVVLADEPTGNLDEANSTRALDLLVNTLKKAKASMLMVTHNKDLTRRMDRVMTIKNRRIFDYNI